MNESTPVLELRNLGPVCQADLAAVGIKNFGDIKSLGVEQTFELVFGYRASKGAIEGLSAVYLYALFGAIHDIDWRRIPAEAKAELKACFHRVTMQHQL
ncbi:MAG: hypothetical protein Aurels2KO_12830 [Aureliella sp.]